MFSHDLIAQFGYSIYQFPVPKSVNKRIKKRNKYAIDNGENNILVFEKSRMGFNISNK